MKANNSTPNFKSRLLTALPLMGLMIVFFSCDFQEYDEKVVLENGEVTSKTIKTDEVFDVVEDAPSFPGGMEAWGEFLGNNLKYPAKAREMGIEGTVYVVFEIRKDGSVKNAEILKGIGGGCDQEALRVIKESPNWTPGKQRGHTVNVRMRVPIRFKLGEGEVVAYFPIKNSLFNFSSKNFSYTNQKTNAKTESILEQKLPSNRWEFLFYKKFVQKEDRQC